MDINTHGGEGTDRAAAAAGAPLDFTTQTENADGAEWKEEVYKKITSMKQMYLSDINDVYRIIASEVQQHDSLPQCPQNEKIEKLKVYKTTLERIVFFLLLKKHDIQQTHKEKLVLAEKYISFFLSSRRPRVHTFSTLQGQLPQSPIQLQQPQFPDGQTNPPMQPVHDSLSGKSTIYISQQHGILSPATGFSQQNLVNGPQEVNVSSLSSQSGTNPVQGNLCSLWQKSSVLQQSLLKLQEQQMLQDQQLRQMYQQQQTFHSQQLLQFQQLIHRNQLMQQQLMQLQQQTVELPAHQMSQLHQMTDANDLNMRQQMGLKAGVLQQQQSVGQRDGFHHPQVKSEISAPQAYEAVSPQQMGMKTGVLQQQLSVGQRDGFHHPQVKSEISSPQAYEAVYPQRQNLPAVDESKKIAYMPWNFQ